MGRRKGELTPNGIDRGWPHQIALHEDVCTGVPHYDIVREFAATLSVCARRHSYSHEGSWYQVFCFREKVDAEKFKERFGGEWFDPARRGRGKGWHLLKESKRRYY
jgi:hypothetical protein